MGATRHDSFLDGHEWDLRLAALLVKSGRIAPPG